MIISMHLEYFGSLWTIKNVNSVRLRKSAILTEFTLFTEDGAVSLE